MKKTLLSTLTYILCAVTILSGVFLTTACQRNGNSVEPNVSEGTDNVVLSDTSVPETPTIPERQSQPAVDPSATAPKTSVDASEFISKDRVKQIVLQKAGIPSDGTVFEDIELDYEYGIYKYEVEFRRGRTEYDAELNATDGAILKWKSEIDD